MLEEIQDSIIERDPERLNKAAHALKGCVANFSLGRAYETTRRLEAVGRDSEMSQAENELKRLEKEIDDLRCGLGSLVKQDDLRQ